MRIAVTHDKGQIFAHFGRSEEFKVYEAAAGRLVSQEVVSADGAGHGALVDVLRGLRVDALICGGIGQGAIRALDAAGIRAYPGVSGSADMAAAALLSGTLVYDREALCDHHGYEGAHDCGEHGCGEHD